MIMQGPTFTGYKIIRDTLKENEQDWVWLPLRIAYDSDLRNAIGAPSFQLPCGYLALIQQGQNMQWHETSHTHMCMH